MEARCSRRRRRVWRFELAPCWFFGNATEPTSSRGRVVPGCINWRMCGRKHSWIRAASVVNQKFLSTLALDGDCAMTKPFDGGQDVVGGFGPAKGLGVGIAGVDVDGDGGLQRGSRAVGAALDLLVGEQREEALDLIDP